MKVSRRIGWVTAMSIVVANMIGAGIFTTSGLMAANLPNAIWVLAFWFAAGIIAISGALCYVELATRMPDQGGEYLYLTRLYHPVFGFLSGWTSFIVGFSAPIAASALGFAEYIMANQAVDTGIDLFLWKKTIAAGIIIVFTVIHYLGIKLGSYVQNILTALKILIILGLVCAGIVVSKGSISHINNFIGEHINTFEFGTAMMFAMFAYSGWNATAYIGGEVKNPRRNLLVSMLGGTVIVMIIYMAINFFIFSSAPYDVLKGSIPILKVASVYAFGSWIGETFGILCGLALLSSLSAYIMIGPRVYFAMARDRHFFPFAAKIHPRYGVPGRSIIIQGLLAVFFVLIGSFDQIIVYLEYALLIFPFLAVTGLFVARKRKIGEATAVKTPGYPIIPLFFLMASLGLMVIAFVNRPIESVSAIITIIIGVPLFYFWRKRFKSK